MAEHTPGPWMPDYTADGNHMANQITHNRDWIAVEVVDEDIGGHVAYCHYRNAPLIAAAPELLAALKRLAEYCESNNGDYDSIGEAHAAITKAERRVE